VGTGTREADHSPLFSVEIGNEWNLTSTPHTSPWHGMGHLKKREMNYSTLNWDLVERLHLTEQETDNNNVKIECNKTVV
jgi:hypothetical protein